MSAIQTETAALIPTGTWTVDPVHSSIRFDVVDTDSMMKSISGRFTDFEGTVEGGEEQSTKGVVRTASVLTDNEIRTTCSGPGDIPRSHSSRAASSTSRVTASRSSAT